MLNMFDHIRIKGFRRLVDVNLPFRPFCVLIGANGVGKTSFLDVFSLLAASAEGKLNSKINELTGINSLITYERTGQLSIELSMSVPQYEPLIYSLSIAPSGPSYILEEERLTQKRRPHLDPFIHIDAHGHDVKYFEVRQNHLLRPTWEHNLLETSLSQVPKMFQEPEDFRRRLASSTFYHALNVEARSPVRLPQPMRPASLPGKDGEDLVSCLYYLRETDRSRFEAIEDALHCAFRDFERLDFPPVAAGTLAMTWKDAHFTRPIYTHQLSEGTLRFLWLTTLLQSPGLTAVTLLDEPEVSLHPELLMLLADMMREASSRTQIIVATHSDRLIQFLKPEEVVVMDVQEDGSSSMIWADDLDLDQWLDEFSLDKVWEMGRMGGRS